MKLDDAAAAVAAATAVDTRGDCSCCGANSMLKASVAAVAATTIAVAAVACDADDAMRVFDDAKKTNSIRIVCVDASVVEHVVVVAAAVVVVVAADSDPWFSASFGHRVRGPSWALPACVRSSFSLHWNLGYYSFSLIKLN